MNAKGVLAGKTCVVTAAGQGIGLASALAFQNAGATVFATDINICALEDHKFLNVHKLDVTNQSAIDEFAKQTGNIDVLFNCAGVVHSGNILECSESEWDFVFKLNAEAMYRMVRAFLLGMEAHGAGSIINMSSVASSVKGVPNRFSYCTSQAAVVGLTKAIAADFVSKGARCNAICPGTVDSSSLHECLRDTGNYEEAMMELISRQPMGRIGKAEEIAHLATYLASDASGFTTDQCHIIDGGWAIRGENNEIR